MNNYNLPKINPSQDYYQTQPLIIVLSGPSGVGKDSVIKTMKAQGMQFHYAVTATTRPIRRGEKDGIHYHFISDELFKTMIKRKQFLEWARVYDYFYGVPIKEVKNAVELGRDVILKIDVQGATTIRQILPEAVFIFLIPSSSEVLAKRLQNRGNQPENNYKLRMLKAEEEIQSKCLFDYVIVNQQNKLELTAFTINCIIVAEKHRSSTRVTNL